MFLEGFHHNLSRYSISGKVESCYYCCHHHIFWSYFLSLHCPSSIQASKHLHLPPTNGDCFPRGRGAIDIISNPRNFFWSQLFFPSSASSFHPSHRSKLIYPRPTSAQDLLYHFPRHWIRNLCRWLLDSLLLPESLLIPYVLPSLFRWSSTWSPLSRLPRL